MPADYPILLWFRQDLRLRDNPALAQAARSGQPVIPLYIHDPAGEGAWPAGAASRWWLHHSLAALSRSLETLGSRLILRAGDSEETLGQLCKATGATAVYWNRRYEPAVTRRDTEIKRRLPETGAQARSFEGALLHSPLKVATKSGGPFKVFTPFWNHIQNLPTRAPEAVPESLFAPAKWPRSLSLDELELLPRRSWANGFASVWQPGEAGAQRALERFEPRSGVYAEARDFPAEDGASKLSPHLHYGEVSIGEVWHRLGGARGEPFRRQLAWREFAHHLLYHFPDTPEAPLREEYGNFPWLRREAVLRAWQRGRTGIPFVDAGMRELWATGGMGNRVRMVAASFLVKHLLQPWQDGAAWFWDTLVDADLANNTLGWQWVAGCGADAAPYFRVFNPAAQGARFDPAGAYTRRWLPELARLPDAWLFQPWAAPAETLRAAGVTLGRDYPRPLATPEEGRAAALAAYAKFKDERKSP